MKRFLSIILLLLLLLPNIGLAQGAPLTILEEGLQTNREQDLLQEAGAFNAFPTRYGAALKTFQALHPQMEIICAATGNHGDMKAVYAALPAGGVDIVGASHVNLWDLYDEGLLLDLSTHPAMAESLSAWPEVSTLLGDGERVFAIPEALRPELMWAPNPALLDTLGVEVDDAAWTWEDFFDIGDLLDAYNQANGTQHSLLASKISSPAWLDQILLNESQAAEPDTQALRTLLPRWKALVDRGLVVDPITYYTTKGQRERTLFVMSVVSAEEALLPPVYRAGIPCRVGIQGSVYFVNANAANAEAAMDFLAAYLDPEAVTASLWYADGGLYPQGAQTTALQALCQEAIAQGYWVRTDDRFTSAYALCDAYLAGTMELEECIQRMFAQMLALQPEA